MKGQGVRVRIKVKNHWSTVSRDKTSKDVRFNSSCVVTTTFTT